jgi:hypothetical protein
MMPARRLKISLLAAAGFGMAMLSSAAIAANVMVVRSSGPSAKVYPPGKTFPGNSRIALMPGDSITLIGSSSARTLRGPGTFPASASGSESLAMVGNRRSRFGALRAADYPQNPSPWNVDVSKGGKMCVIDTASVLLWRPYATDTVQLRIMPLSGLAETVEWAAGQATVRWPAKLPIAEGAQYKLETEGSDPVPVSFVRVASPPDDMVGAAQTLIEKGCDSQLDTLVEGLNKQ